MKTAKEYLRGSVRDYRVFDTASQNEALINEFKGNLFEYLVGAELSRSISKEAEFLRTMSSDLAVRLRGYEDWLWQNDSQLAEQLPRLAQSTSEYILKNLDQKFSKVLVIGKLAGGSHDESFGEADLLLVTKDDQPIPLSLKLCKKGAYVNTKSAGIRSFLSKYFSEVPNIDLAQEQVNVVLDQSFSELAQTLHERHGLDSSSNFATAWKDAGLPLLPGELNQDDQALLQQHYSKIVTLLSHSLGQAFELARPEFNRSLAAILGLKVKGMIQVTCSHKEIKSKRYELDHISMVKEGERLEQLEQAVFHPVTDGLASFNVEFPWGILQIRVKPMNKFTQAALKVNCSVREADL
ncbi:MAG: hypothetical protein CME71_09765 [Halobacteriovorax sp.]|nr:hypothetical protein [Halobacteriovorax sp.]